MCPPSFPQRRPAIDQARVRSGLAVPIMDTTRVREELSWEPRHSSLDAIRDVLAGIADAEGEPTPPLETARR